MTNIPAITPRLLTAQQAATYTGCLNAEQWRREVREGKWPAAMPMKRKHHVWCVRELDKAIDRKLGYQAPRDRLMEKIDALSKA